MRDGQMQKRKGFLKTRFAASDDLSRRTNVAKEKWKGGRGVEGGVETIAVFLQLNLN